MKNQKSKAQRKKIFRLVAAILGVCALAIIGPLFLERQIALGALSIPKGLTAGEPAPRDIYAEEDIQFIDKELTQEKRTEAAAEVQPVFNLSQDTSFRVINRLKALNAELARGEEIQVMYERFSPPFSAMQLWGLTQLDGEKMETVTGLADEYLRYFLGAGVVDEDDLEKVGYPELIDVRGLERTEPEGFVEESVEQFYRTDQIEEVLISKMDDSGIPRELYPGVFDIVLALIEPNILYDDVSTRERMREAEEKVSPVVQHISRGEIIVKEGFLVTDQAIEQLREMQQQMYSKSPLTVLSQSIFIVIIFSLFFTSIYMLLPNNFRKIQFMHMVNLFVLIFTIYLTAATYFFFQNSFEMNIFFYPVALFAMLAITLLGNMQIAVLIPVFLASLYGTIPGSTFFDVIFLTVIGILGILFVRSPYRRIDMVLGTGKLLLSYIGIALVYLFHQNIAVTHAPLILGSASLNAAATGIMVIITIPIFEHAYNLATVFRLKELADTNNPILKRMINTARGTYSHSVSVAELVDSVSEEIGANKLLAKAGAIYHDIGKIDQPEYFIENQSGMNKHDEIKPSLSVAIIKSHVKVGIEKAKQLRFPREVQDIIAQHHGSDLINYFYMEAIKSTTKGEKINEKDFSYQGDPPMSKEAALIMIADSVDAAVRTMKQPTSPKIEKMIWHIIMEKIERQQLINCDISMKDLETVKKGFLVILTGRFHTRIPYPQAQKRKRQNGQRD